VTNIAASCHRVLLGAVLAASPPLPPLLLALPPMRNSGAALSPYGNQPYLLVLRINRHSVHSSRQEAKRTLG
jgi:hypothetical protein